MIECKAQIKQLQSAVRAAKASALTMWTQDEVDVAMAREAKADREKADAKLNKAKEKLKEKLDKERSDHAETKNTLRLLMAENKKPPPRTQSGTNQSGGGVEGAGELLRKQRESEEKINVAQTAVVNKQQLKLMQTMREGMIDVLQVGSGRRRGRSRSHGRSHSRSRSRSDDSDSPSRSRSRSRSHSRSRRKSKKRSRKKKRKKTRKGKVGSGSE